MLDAAWTVQHLIVVVLVVAGAVRAIIDGDAVPWTVAAGLALLLVYGAGIALFFRRRPRRYPVWWLIALGVVWVAAMTVSVEFVWVAFVLWLLAGHLMPGWTALGYSAVVLGVATVAPIAHFGETTSANVVGTVIGAVFALGISRGYLELLWEAEERERLVASLTRMQREMTDLQDELADAQRRSGAVAERTRLSRDIHDTIAQTLSSIRLVALAAVPRTRERGAVEALRQAQELAQGGLADVRRIVEALAPAELEGGALAAALTRILDDFRKLTGVEARLDLDDSVPTLATATEAALLRIAQSALANVRLHAHAGLVVVSMARVENRVHLDVVDDGRGFDAAAWERAPETGGSSYGLRFMRSRLRELGGDLVVESAAGTGTAVSAQVPFGRDGERLAG